jgi:hypothetical protein
MCGKRITQVNESSLYIIHSFIHSIINYLFIQSNIHIYVQCFFYCRCQQPRLPPSSLINPSLPLEEERQRLEERQQEFSSSNEMNQWVRILFYFIVLQIWIAYMIFISIILYQSAEAPSAEACQH